MDGSPLSLTVNDAPASVFLRRFMSDSFLASRQRESLHQPPNLPHLQLCPPPNSMLLYAPVPTPFFQPSTSRIGGESSSAAAKRRAHARMTSSSNDELATPQSTEPLQFHVPKESLLLIERFGCDSRPSRRTKKFQDLLHFHLSEVLIATFEELSWKRKMDQLKAELDDESADEVPITTALQPSTSFADFRQRSGQFGHQEEGNSTFYQNRTPSAEPQDQVDVEVEEEFEEPLIQFEQCNLEESTSNSPSPNEDSPLLHSGPTSEGAGESDNDPSSAERVASDLLRYFASQKEVMDSVNPEDVNWLVSFADAPQKLLPLPANSTDVVVQPDEIYTTDGKRILLRGTSTWAPPKKKFIFREPPYVTQRDMIEMQNYRCAGCGMKLDKIYVKRTRYCNYYGKWFCQVCHQGAKHRIPAKIIKAWDFQAYPVSDIGFNFLSENVHQPVFDIEAIDCSLFQRNKQMRRMKQIRMKLAHLWSYISVCRIAQRTVTENGNLKTMFTSLPQRYLLLSQVDIYTLVDLELVYSKNLFESLEPVVRYGELHTESCEECRHRGFFCELCQFSELLFPFYLDKVVRCGECGSLSHVKCYKKMRKLNPQSNCPKCERRRVHDQRREELALSRSLDLEEADSSESRNEA